VVGVFYGASLPLRLNRSALCATLDISGILCDFGHLTFYCISFAFVKLPAKPTKYYGVWTNGVEILYAYFVI
jgi:hypothetical protein